MYEPGEILRVVNPYQERNSLAKGKLVKVVKMGANYGDGELYVKFEPLTPWPWRKNSSSFTWNVNRFERL